MKKEKIKFIIGLSFVIILFISGCQGSAPILSSDQPPSCCQITDAYGNTLKCDSRISEENCYPPYNYYAGVDCENLEGNPCEGKMSCIYNKTSYDYGETVCQDGKLWLCDQQNKGFKAVGDCIPTISGNIINLNFDEGSGEMINDMGGNNNNGRLGLKDLTNTWPKWTTTTPYNKGYALNFDTGKSHVRIPLSDSLKGLTNNMESSFTIEAWVKPDITKPGAVQRIAGIPWVFYLQQSYYEYQGVKLNMRYEFIIGINGIADDYINDKPWHYDWVTSNWMPVDDNWRHVAATYDAVKREIKIYVNNELVGSANLTDVNFHGGIFNLNTHVPFKNPWWDKVSLDQETFSGWQYLTIGTTYPFYEAYIPTSLHYPFYGIIDDVKIFDNVKTCFDLDGDDYEDCACKKFELKYEVNGEAITALPEGDICPAQAEINKDKLEVYRKDANGEFTIPVINQLCSGEPLSLAYSKLGKYQITKNVYGCDYSCYESCSESCMNVYLRDCVYTCTTRCSNSVCFSYTGATCGGAGGQNLSYCTYVFSSATSEASKTECYNISLAPEWNGTICNNMCQTKCGSSPTQISKVTYDKPCGFELKEILELRKGNDCATGNLEASYQIGGYGTTNLLISAPQNPGNYLVCFKNEKLGELIVKNRGSADCPSKKDICSLKLDPNHLIINQEQKGSPVTIKGTIINNATSKTRYDLKIYTKRLNTDTATSFSGPKPSGLKLSIEQTSQLSPGDDETFTITYNVPQQPYERKICEKEVGKSKLGCEVNTKKLDKQRYYSNIIVRASETAVGEGVCEASFNIDQTPSCVEEICGNNKDDDCDNVIDEGIIAVEVVNQTINGAPEPYAGAVVKFYEYDPNKMPICMPGVAPEHYKTIITNCKPQASCITNENGYCLAEVPVFIEPDHYMAIATVAGDTSKHLGIPVSAVHCGKIKKTWHLQYRDF